MKLHLKITSTILCLSLLFLSSCAETPESVKKGSKNENTATHGYALTSLDEMSKKKSEYIDELKKLECDNMNFSDILDIDIPQKIKTGDFICPTGFEDNYKEIFTHYDEDFNEANITNDDTTYPTGPSYEDKEKGLQLSIGCTGFFRIKRFLMCKNITMNPNSSRRFHTPKLWKAQKNISLLAVKESYLCLRL